MPSEVKKKKGTQMSRIYNIKPGQKGCIKNLQAEGIQAGEFSTNLKEAPGLQKYLKSRKKNQVIKTPQNYTSTTCSFKKRIHPDITF